MKKQTDSSSTQLSKEGKVKMGFVIQNSQNSNTNAATKRKDRSVSPQSQNTNTINQLGYLESQQSVQNKFQKNEKSYISQLETQLKVHNKKKNDLVDNNHNLEYLLKIQDQKIQTYIDEIKQLRSYNEQLFKENKQLHLRVETFAQEKNHLVQDNKVLKETVKKLEVRLSLPVRPPQKKNVLKTLADFSRENQYIDGTLLQNDQTIQQYGSSGQSLNQQQYNTQASHLSRSSSPQDRNLTEGSLIGQRKSLSTLHQRNLSNNSQQQQGIAGSMGNSLNNNQFNISSPGTSSSHSKANAQPQSQQFLSQMNSNRSSQQFSQMPQFQQSSAHFNNNINNQSSLLQTANLQADQSNKELYTQKLMEQIKVLEDERETFQYEIKLLNQALGKDSSNEPMQKLIKDLVDSQQQIAQFTRNQSFLEDKITQFEKLVDSYTQNNPFQMDRASLERKNTFLQQENYTLAATIKTLKEEMSLWNSNSHPLQIQQLEQEKNLSVNNSNYMTTQTSRRDHKRQIKETSSPLSNRSNTSRVSLSQSPRSSGTQAGQKQGKLTLAASIKNQKMNGKGRDKLSNCCKDPKRLGSKIRRSDKEGSSTLYHSSSGLSYDIDETRRLLQVEKQKNQLLSKMVEEEQEKNSEYLVYKEEIDFYHQKNKMLQSQILLLQNQLHQFQLSNLSIKVPITPNTNAASIEGTSQTPRQVSLSPRQQIKRICNTQMPLQGKLKRPQSPNSPGSPPPSQQVLNYEPRSPPQSARNKTQGNGDYSDDDDEEGGVRNSRVSGIAGRNRGKKRNLKNGNAVNVEEESEQVLAFMQIEKELNQELQKKEKQIENIINSRNLMQKTLGDQLKIVKASNKDLDEQNKHLQNQIIIINEELRSLRILVKRAEKKNLIGNDFIPHEDDY